MTTGHPLILGKDGGGLRHYLDGKPVHCGTGLLLGAERWDGKPLWIPVRYEASWANSTEGPAVEAVLYLDLLEVPSLPIPHRADMQLRWPPRTRSRASLTGHWSEA